MKFLPTDFRARKGAFRLTALLSVWAVATVGSAQSGPSHAQDFDKGRDAYQRNHFDAARAEFHPLAEAGHATAQYYMGNLQLRRSETKTAIAYFTKSADQGFRSAQYNLGVIFARGDGVAKDPEAAFKWYGMAAAQGHPTAQFNLGVFYRDGLGPAADGRKAIEWFTRSAENGNVFAQINLARIYTLGKVAPKDLTRAYMWLEIARNPFGPQANRAPSDRIANVRNSAITAQNLLEEQISPADIARAKERARDWQGKLGTAGKQSRNRRHPQASAS